MCVYGCDATCVHSNGGKHEEDSDMHVSGPVPLADLIDLSAEDRCAIISDLVKIEKANLEKRNRELEAALEANKAAVARYQLERSETESRTRCLLKDRERLHNFTAYLILGLIMASIAAVALGWAGLNCYLELQEKEKIIKILKNPAV